MDLTIEIVLMVFGAVLMLTGIIGCIVPFLPGPPLCYVALLLAHFTSSIQFSTNFLLWWAIIVIVVGLLDYLIPIWGAKNFGGTKAGMWGAAIGLVVGVILLPPIGVIVGPVVGAFMGELMVHGSDVGKALKSAMGALIGFVLSTGLKLTVCFVMTFYFVKEIIVSFAG